MKESVKYSTISSYILSESFINIKSVCIIRGAYNKVSICVRAQGTRLPLTGYGEPTWEYRYFYIPCSKFGNPVVGTVITPELYNSIIIMEKKTERVKDEEELARFYKVKFSSSVKY